MFKKFVLVTIVLVLGGAIAAYAQQSRPFFPLFQRGATAPPSTGPSGPYVGPGDIIAPATHQVWYGVRAYSAATRGQKLLHVCDNTRVPRTVVIGTGDGTTTVFPFTAAAMPGIVLPMRVGSVQINTTISTTVVATGVVTHGVAWGTYDQYNGVLLHYYASASNRDRTTVNYDTGAGTVTFGAAVTVNGVLYAAAPDAGAAVTLTYDQIADNVCADMLSDASTGDIVPETIGASTCPNLLGTCTVQTAYDQTGHGIDVTQNTINRRPLLMSRAIPILGTENRACMFYQDWAASYTGWVGSTGMKSSATVNWGPAPLTMSAFAINTDPGGNGRPGNTATNSVVLRPSSGTPLIQYFSSSGTVTDVMVVSAGTSAQVPGGTFSTGNLPVAQPYVIDHAPHAIQVTFTAAGTTSSAYVDGFNYPSLNAGTTIAGSSTVELGGVDDTVSRHFDGVLCEAGFAQGDQSSHNAAMDANQNAYYKTVTNPHTPVHEALINFNTLTPGTRATWDVMNSVSTAPNPWMGVTAADNYVYKAANGTQFPNPNEQPCSVTGPTAPTTWAQCIPSPLQALDWIVGDGPNSTCTDRLCASGGTPDPAFEMTYATGDTGGPINYIGLAHFNWYFPITPADSVDVGSVEWDQMWRSKDTALPDRLTGIINDFDMTGVGKPGGYGTGFLGGEGDSTNVQEEWYSVFTNRTLSIGTGNGSNPTFSGTLTGGLPLTYDRGTSVATKVGGVGVTASNFETGEIGAWAAAVKNTATGAVISGLTASGSVNYLTGAVTITWSTPPDNAATVIVSYSTPNLDVNGHAQSYTYTDVGGDGGYGFSEDNTSFGRAMGINQMGVWYHRRADVVLGPNGYMAFYRNDGPGTPTTLRHMVSRATPMRYFPAPINSFLGPITNMPNPRTPIVYNGRTLNLYATIAWAFAPHFGGGPPDAARWDSQVVFDNVHVTLYKR